MNGEIGRIPIQTLGAITSLTDILPDLPLPTPSSSPSASTAAGDDAELSSTTTAAAGNSTNRHATTDSSSLLADLDKTLASSRRYSTLNNDDSGQLSRSVVNALAASCTNSIEFKDNSSSTGCICLDQLPPLFARTLLEHQSLFSGKLGFANLTSISSSSSTVFNTSLPRPNSADVISAPLKREPSASTVLPTIVANNSVDDPNSPSIANGGSKKKRKHKKHRHHHKHHRHRSASCELTSAGSSNESESTSIPVTDNATTKTSVNAADVIPKLKIFKRPSGDLTAQAITSKCLNADNNEKLLLALKAKKKKKKDKKSREKEEDESVKQSPHPTPPPGVSLLSNPVSNNIHPPTDLPSPPSGHVTGLDGGLFDDHLAAAAAAATSNGIAAVSNNSNLLFDEMLLPPVDSTAASQQQPVVNDTTTNLIDYASRFLLMQATNTNQSPPPTVVGGNNSVVNDDDDYYYQMVASLGNCPSPPDVSTLPSTTTAAAANDINRLPPTGLASYLSNPPEQVTEVGRSTTTTTVASAATDASNRAYWQRRIRRGGGKPSSSSSRRPAGRRRKNELEGLANWTVNYPAGSNKAAASADPSADSQQQCSWASAVDRCSQDWSKRRKRLARESAAAGAGAASVANGPLGADFVFDTQREYYENGVDQPQSGQDQDSTNRTARPGNRCYAGMDANEDDVDGDANWSIGGRKRKSEFGNDDDDNDQSYEVRLKEPVENRFPHLIASETGGGASQRRRRERVPLVPSSSLLPSSSGVDSITLKRFAKRLARVCEAVEEADLSNCLTSITSDVAPSPETFISQTELSDLVTDAAKLNSLATANQLPTDQLLKLMTVLLVNIRDGANVIASTRQDEDDGNEAGNKLWHELALDRVMRSVNASLTGLFLMTSPDMPREIYVEDVIDRVVGTVRYQLVNCIFPEYDPAYRVENTAKENQSSIKSRRARERGSDLAHKPKSISLLYRKLVDTLASLAKLVSIQRLTDNHVLALSSIGVSVFFVENISQIQLAALDLVTALFARYEPHRTLIIDELLASLARLPSSKRNLRCFRLNSEDNIQMLTALALLLVQSVIVLPSSSSTSSSADSSSAVVASSSSTSPHPQLDNGGQQLTDQSVDDEVVIVRSYRAALRTAHAFLTGFLRKSTLKGEDDYRMIFENFVNDLLLSVNKPEWPAAEVMLSLLGSLLVQQFNNKSLDQSIRVASVDYLGTVASTLRRDAVSSQLKEADIDGVIRDLIDGSSSSESEASSDEDEDVKVINPEDETDLKVNGIDDPSEVHDQKRVKKAEKKKRPKRQQFSTDGDPVKHLDRVQALRDAILYFLASEEAGASVQYTRSFYLAQWLTDCTKESERAAQSRSAANSNQSDVDAQSSRNRRTSRPVDDDQDDERMLQLAEVRRQHIIGQLRQPEGEWKKQSHGGGGGWYHNPVLLSSITTSSKRRSKTANKSAPVNMQLLFRGSLDYEDCCLVCRYLASLRPFSQSFDIYLSQIHKLLGETSVPVRTKALRCLSAVVEADPNVLARADIEAAVHSRLLDTSTSVREAAVDLLGRFLSCKPELTTQYYPMLIERIRDKGISVRKRVIRILRDICLEQPDFAKVPEMCVKMIRRVNDEEGIKKLVNEVFQTMWFTPVRDRDSVKLLQKVLNVTDVVAACKEVGYEWFEQFLRSILSKDEVDKTRPVERACHQLVECLVQNIMRLEEVSGENTSRITACFIMLHMITKIRPDFMLKHTLVLHTYLRDNKSTSDSNVLFYVARILEVTVPLIDHPSETMIAQLEEDMVRLVLRQGKMVVEACVACLGSIVNRVSQNYRLARDCFTGFFLTLQRCRAELQAGDGEGEESNAKRQSLLTPSLRPSILRALFTIGLLCKHFDPQLFKSDKLPMANIRDEVFDTLMYFTEQVEWDAELRKKALSGLGFFCTRHHDMLNGQRMADFYRKILRHPCPASPHQLRLPIARQDSSIQLKVIVLENLLSFFLDEEQRMLDADAKWKAMHRQESLKEMGDLTSGMGSCVAQTYLKDILESFFSPFLTIRLTALSVVSTILRQGLIHPVQTVPYLIAAQTDADQGVKSKAECQLQEIDQKFPGYLGMRAIQGIDLSFRLQHVLHPLLLSSSSSANLSTNSITAADTSTDNANSLQSPKSTSSTSTLPAAATPGKGGSTRGVSANPTAIRGSPDPNQDVPAALNSQLYSMLRGSRGHRRNLLTGLIALFDDEKILLSKLVYVADNLAFFPYQCQDEPLFVVHHIDLNVSMVGSSVLQAVRQALFPELKAQLEAFLVQHHQEQQLRMQQEQQQLLQAQQQANVALEQQYHQQYALGGWPPPPQQQYPAPGSIVPACQSTPTLASPQSLRGMAPQPPPVDVDDHTTYRITVCRKCIDYFMPNFSLGPLEEEEDNRDALLRRLTQLQSTAQPIVSKAIRTSRACVLLLTLKQYLKELYSLTDAKIQRYSPADSPKLWEKQLTRRTGIRFNPPDRCLLLAVRREADDQVPDDSANELVDEYIDFRRLMLAIDPVVGDDDGLPSTLPPGMDLDSGQPTMTNISSSLLTGQPTIAGGVSSSYGATNTNHLRLRPGGRSQPSTTTVVPQSHNKSSDEDVESDDSNAGGASRLRLAMSAPNSKRRRSRHPQLSSNRASGGGASRVKRRKRNKRRYSNAMGSSSGDESESDLESDQSDPDY